MSGVVPGNSLGRPRLRLRQEDPEAAMRATEMLRQRSLPAYPLDQADDGEDNLVFLAPAHVVRLKGGWLYDHRKEALAASQARSLGARAPVCLGAGDGWSIWERLPGTNFWRAPKVSEKFWAALCHDLAKLHALPAPTDVVLPDLTEWHADVPFLEELHESEMRVVRWAMEEPIPTSRIAFGHGDVHGGNIMVGPDGSYAGLIDWASGGWWPPEWDYAMFDSEGLRHAIDAPFEPLDWSLLATFRVGAFVRLYRAGFVGLDDLREALGFWELMR